MLRSATIATRPQKWLFEVLWIAYFLCIVALVASCSWSLVLHPVLETQAANKVKLLYRLIRLRTGF